MRTDRVEDEKHRDQYVGGPRQAPLPISTYDPGDADKEQKVFEQPGGPAARRNGSRGPDNRRRAQQRFLKGAHRVANSTFTEIKAHLQFSRAGQAMNGEWSPVQTGLASVTDRHPIALMPVNAGRIVRRRLRSGCRGYLPTALTLINESRRGYPYILTSRM
jgi:hypothetical protein